MITRHAIQQHVLHNQHFTQKHVGALASIPLHPSLWPLLKKNLNDFERYWPYLWYVDKTKTQIFQKILKKYTIYLFFSVKIHLIPKITMFYDRGSWQVKWPLQTWNLSWMHKFYQCKVSFHWSKILLWTYTLFVLNSLTFAVSCCCCW